MNVLAVVRSHDVSQINHTIRFRNKVAFVVLLPCARINTHRGQTHCHSCRDSCQSESRSPAQAEDTIIVYTGHCLYQSYLEYPGDLICDCRAHHPPTGFSIGLVCPSSGLGKVGCDQDLILSKHRNGACQRLSLIDSEWQRPGRSSSSGPGRVYE